MESGVCVDCITVEAVSDVLTLQFRQRKTTEERDGKRYGLSLWPQLGQINPPVQRNASRYLAQATSSGKTFCNSGSGGGRKTMGVPVRAGGGAETPAGPAQCLKVLGASDVIRKNFLEFREGGGESAWVHRSKKPKIGFCQQTG